MFDDVKSFFEKIMNKEGRLFSRGLKLSNAGKYDEAILCFDELIKIHPKDSELYNAKGSVYYLSKNHDKAIELYDDAISLNENNFRAYQNKGIVYHAKEDYIKAIENFNQVIEINPKHFDAWDHKSLVLRKQNKFDDSIQCLRETLKIRPKEKENYYEIACVMALQDKYKSQKNNKKRMIDILEDLLAKGYFFKKKNRLRFFDDEDFNFYKKDKDFERFVSNLK